MSLNEWSLFPFVKHTCYFDNGNNDYKDYNSLGFYLLNTPTNLTMVKMIITITIHLLK